MWPPPHPSSDWGPPVTPLGTPTGPPSPLTLQGAWASSLLRAQSSPCPNVNDWEWFIHKQLQLQARSFLLSLAPGSECQASTRKVTSLGPSPGWRSNWNPQLGALEESLALSLSLKILQRTLSGFTPGLCPGQPHLLGPISLRSRCAKGFGLQDLAHPGWLSVWPGWGGRDPTVPCTCPGPPCSKQTRSQCLWKAQCG